MAYALKQGDDVITMWKNQSAFEYELDRIAKYNLPHMTPKRMHEILDRPSPISQGIKALYQDIQQGAQVYKNGVDISIKPKNPDS